MEENKITRETIKEMAELTFDAYVSGIEQGVAAAKKGKIKTLFIGTFIGVGISSVIYAYNQLKPKEAEEKKEDTYVYGEES